MYGQLQLVDLGTHIRDIEVEDNECRGSRRQSIEEARPAHWSRTICPRCGDSISSLPSGSLLHKRLAHTAIVKKRRRRFRRPLRAASVVLYSNEFLLSANATLPTIFIQFPMHHRSRPSYKYASHPSTPMPHLPGLALPFQAMTGAHPLPQLTEGMIHQQRFQVLTLAKLQISPFASSSLAGTLATIYGGLNRILSCRTSWKYVRPRMIDLLGFLPFSLLPWVLEYCTKHHSSTGVFESYRGGSALNFLMASPRLHTVSKMSRKLLYNDTLARKTQARY
jgi:hypothetical protein